MKFKKILMVSAATLSMGVGLAITHQTAQARINGVSMSQDSHFLVRAKRTVAVYKVTTGAYMAKNHYHFFKYLHKGSKVYTSRLFMSPDGWIIKSSGVYRPTRHSFYLVPSGHKWYTRIR